jgi:hypothetical protein
VYLDGEGVVVGLRGMECPYPSLLRWRDTPGRNGRLSGGCGKGNSDARVAIWAMGGLRKQLAKHHRLLGFDRHPGGDLRSARLGYERLGLGAADSLAISFAVFRGSVGVALRENLTGWASSRSPA